MTGLLCNNNFPTIKSDTKADQPGMVKTKLQNLQPATITTQLVTDEGILREMKPEIDDSNDGVQFKGIFIRHLAFL